MKTTRISFLAALLPLTLMLACTDAAKVPAEAALQAAEAAVSSLGDVATKYLPDQTQELQTALNDARGLAAKKDYKGALAAASAIPDKAKQVLAAATAKKEQLLKTWEETSSSIPDLLSALKSRLDILAQAKKLPTGMTTTTLDEARAGANNIETGFGEAQAQAQGGDYEAAIAKAAELRGRGQDIMKSIGMTQ